MTLLRTLQLTTDGMTAQRTRVNVAAMNMANASTTRTAEGGPYKRRDVVLEAIDDPRVGFANQLRTAMGDTPMQTVMVRSIEVSQDPANLVYDPGHPDADAAGYVALPNVSSIEEMVNLMGAARAYEAGTSVLKTVRGMAEQALRIGK